MTQKLEKYHYFAVMVTGIFTILFNESQVEYLRKAFTKEKEKSVNDLFYFSFITFLWPKLNKSLLYSKATLYEGLFG